MKKILLLSALAVAATMTAGAKTADELRVYINPGHGSWTPNDRPNPIIGHGAYSRTNTDTLNFFESNTNLRKGFGVLERLVDYGLKFDRTKNQEGERWQIGAARDMENNIVMSHVKCGPYHDDNGTKNQLGAATPADIYYYNRNLGEICEEVDANNFDMFISIHSNAATEGTSTNYLLFEYRGYDDMHAATGLTTEHQQISRKMAEAAWGYAFENPFMAWTSYSMTNRNIRGDINFGGQSGAATGVTGAYGWLGVLKHHTPGYLVEGYFHTYQPGRHRAMNFDVARVEGIAYAHGLADYFGLQKENFGTVYGIVRDLHEKFTHQYYKPNAATDDLFKPINGCKVSLVKDGKTVAEYTTDEQYNGAFVFDRVEPGKYTLVFEHPDYKAIDPVEVTVEAAKVAYPTARMENKDYVAPTKVYVDYPDPAAEVSGVNPAEEYVFTSEYTDEPIAELAGKIVRRAIVQDGKMYILAIDKLPTYAQVVPDDQKPVPTIIVYDLNKKEVLANVSTEGTYGSIQNVADIQVTSDGVLLAGNQTKNQFSADYVENLPDGTKEPRGTWVLYRWDNDDKGLPTGAPKEWITDQSNGRWFRAYVGSTFAYTGTSEDGKLIVAAPSITGPNYMLRSNEIAIVNGTKGGVSAATTPNNVGETALGNDYRYAASPLGNDEFIITNAAGNAYKHSFIAPDKAPFTAGNEESAVAAASGMFKYAGASYIVAPANEDGKNVGVRLVDITADVTNAAPISTTNTTLEAVEAPAAAAGETGYTYDLVNNAYTSAWINLYLLRDGKITKLTTKNVKQPVYKTEFAYGLTADETDAGYNVNYSITGDAVAANLVLTPVDGQGEAVTIALDATKGAHSYALEASNLADGVVYNWAVNVESKSNAGAGQVFAAAAPQTVRGSVITFNDPTTPSFGYTVVGHNVENGFDIYNPAGELVATEVHKGHKLHGAGGKFNQSNPLRGAEHMGHALVAAWGDGAWGVTAFNPLDPSEDLYSVFEGEKNSAGLISYNGVGIGSGTPCVAVQGRGENARLFTFDEDLLGNKIAVYNIGANRTITTAPADWGQNGLANTNVDIVPVSNGIFASQVRADFYDVTPSFTFIDNDGNRLWSTNEKEDWPADMIKDCNSGIAVSADEHLLAVSGKTGIRVFKLSFDKGNCPVLEHFVSIDKPTDDWGTMRFDAANNLHYYGRGTGYQVYAMPAKNPVVSTPATLTIQGQTGVSDIAVDNAQDGPAVYYNLNGIQVPAENLVPGVYVKVVGNTATKVIVK